MSVFSKNLKRFRIAQNLTQEQAAEVLGVSAQTISRWECQITLPDVSILPKIAKLYCVTIDDLYQETATAYKNYAQRLGSVFEATRKTEDFLRADMEYQKLLKTNQVSTEDLRLYGVLHEQMMQNCISKAEDLFNQVIRKGPDEESDTYWATQRQKIYFLSQIGRIQESIQTFLPLVISGSRNVQEWICLILAYSYAEMYDIALEWAGKAENSFPENAALHICIGDLLRSMKRYEEAFSHWKRALELEPDWLSAAFSIASCYEEIEAYAEAEAVYNEIADQLERHGYEAEVTLPRTLAKKCRAYISN